MAGMNCKCGGKYVRTNYDSAYIYYACDSAHCDNHYKRTRKSKHPTDSVKTHTFSHLEIGKGVADYLLYLEHENNLLQQKVKELEGCLSERDALQKQVIEMQEKYNEMVLEKPVTIPAKVF